MRRLGDRLGVLCGVVAGALAVAPAARAEGVSDATAAEAVSQAAAELLAQGFTSSACLKYREAASIEPSASRFLALGTCWERAGRTASAWEAYRRSGELAALGEPERELAARQGETRLAPLLTRLQINAPANAYATEVTIDLDGAHLAPALYGVAVPVDPGTHYVTAVAPGRQRWSLQVTLPATAATTELSVPALAPVAVTAAPTPPRPTPAADAPSGPDRNAARPGQTQRTVGLVLGGSGIATMGAGVAFAIAASKQQSRVDQLCTDEGTCPAAARADLDGARRDATIANVALGAGALTLATGIVVYLLAPSDRPKRSASVSVLPSFDTQAAGVLARGVF